MIQGQKTILLPVKVENLEILRNWRNSPEIAQHFRQREYISKELQVQWFNENKHGFGIHKLPLGLIGYCGLSHVSTLHKTAIFSIYIGNPEYRGRGYGTDALHSLLSYGFEELELNRIFSEVHSENPALKVYTKLGFVKEGNLRESFEYNGRLIDSYIIGILRREFIK